MIFFLPLFVGGGGGGGFVQIYSLTNNYGSYSFQGSFVANGGNAGIVTSTEVEVAEDGTFRQMLNRFSPYLTDFQAATSGEAGVISVPSCQPGYGSDPIEGKICYRCPVGEWSPGGTGDCMACTNAPTHSSYTESGVSTSNCPFECDSGYSTTSCLDQLQIFIFNTLTLGGVAGVCCGILAIILIPLFYYRYKRYNDWGDRQHDQGDFFKKVIFLDLGYGADDPSNKNRGQSGRLNMVQNPMSVKANAVGDLEDIKVVAIRKLQMKRGKEMRREHRMADQDMIFHACRVNLFGCNHPHQSQGKFSSFPISFQSHLMKSCP